MFKNLHLLLFLLISFGLINNASATEVAAASAPEAQRSITQHSAKCNGKTIKYSVHAGDHFLYDEERTPKDTI